MRSESSNTLSSSIDSTREECSERRVYSEEVTFVRRRRRKAMQNEDNEEERKSSDSSGKPRVRIVGASPLFTSSKSALNTINSDLNNLKEVKNKDFSIRTLRKRSYRLIDTSTVTNNDNVSTISILEPIKRSEKERKNDHILKKISKKVKLVKRTFLIIFSLLLMSQLIYGASTQQNEQNSDDYNLDENDDDPYSMSTSRFNLRQQQHQQRQNAKGSRNNFNYNGFVNAKDNDNKDNEQHHSNRHIHHTHSGNSSGHTVLCKDGLVMKAWKPLTNLSNGDIIARGLVYFFALVYLFVGVSIIADRFMAAIEVITSQEKEVIIKKPNGEQQVISVRIWNETVSNLTLMALGSSAPEILLSIIEVYAQDYKAGELGPGTIVGSAAFNMFVIIAVCVWVVPTNEIKKIKHLRVFFVTMIWSVFAYIWLLAILSWISYGVVEIWEGLLTFLFFPATVITAYIADRRLLIYKYLSKQYRMNRRGVVVATEGLDAEDLEMGGIGADGQRKSIAGNHIPDGGFKIFEEETNDEVREFEEHRREYISLLRELRKKHPNAPIEEIELMAREDIFNRGPKSRAFYRLQATKKLTGGAAPFKRRVEKVEDKKEKDKKKEDEFVVKIFFDPAHYTVLESVGEFAVTITREGDLQHAIAVDFKTEDGTANAGSDFEEVEETLIFRSGETHKQVNITVIDDDVFEEDEHFYCRLTNPRYVYGTDGQMNGGPAPPTPPGYPPIQLATPAIATVMILDDDHGGIFAFDEEQYEVNEAVGQYMLKITRYSGARGKVYLPYKTIEDTAKNEKDFILTEGQIIFENNESTAEIPIQIIDNESYEKDAMFYVEIYDPIREEDMESDESKEDANEAANVQSETNINKSELNEDNNNVDDEKNEIENERISKKGNLSPRSVLSEEEQNIALLGRPKLGEITRCQIRIKESKEFKNTVDKLFRKANTSFVVGASSWKEQFIEAITVSAGDDDDEGGEEGEGEEGEREEKMPSCSDYVMHFLTLFWKVLFAFVPPTDIWGGWACFLASIFIIGVLTAVVGDVASHFGCVVGLKDTVTAISVVALGTSVPDTFASKVAAINDKYADSSIGNVTGSNAVNVFLGIGIAWTIAAVVNFMDDNKKFEVEPGNLAFSVALFCLCAFICCAGLLIRRWTLGGELGGPLKWKVVTSTFFVGLWLLYVLLSSLDAYGMLPNFH